MSDQENRLRDALSRAVPTPPTNGIDPAALADRARVRRQRRRALEVAAVAVAVAAAVIVPGQLVNRGAQQDPKPTAPSPVPSPTQGPLRLDCPTLPSSPDAIPHSFPAGAVNEIKLCNWVTGELPTMQPFDALVSNRQGFVDEVKALPPANKDRCDRGGVVTEPDDSLLTLAVWVDGSPTLVKMGACHDVRIDGKDVESEAVLSLYAEAISRQRDEDGPPRDLQPQAITCQTVGTFLPVKRGREQINEVVLCPRQTEDEVGTSPSVEQLNAIKAAFARIGPRTEKCESDPVGGGGIKVRTNFGDILTFNDAACGVLTRNEMTVVEEPPVTISFTPAQLRLLGISR